MDIDKEIKTFEDETLSTSDFTSNQKRLLVDCFKCGWEAYERSVNNNNLIITDVKSIKYISDFSENISRCVEASSENVFVKLPTQSPFMITANTIEDLIDAVDLYKEY